MNRVYQRRREIIGGLILLLLIDAGVYIGWVRRPVVAQSAEDPAELARLQAEVDARAREVARLERVRERAPRLRPKLEKFTSDRLLSEAAGYSRLAADLEEAAQQAEVRLGRVSYDATEEKNQPDLLRVQIATSVEGSYRNLLDYLSALEQSPHLYLIDQLNVGSARGGQVRLEVRLATYLRRPA